MVVVTSLDVGVVTKLVNVFTGHARGRTFVHSVQTKLAMLRDLVGVNELQETVLESPYNM